MQQIGRFQRSVEAQADELCYAHSILLCRNIQGNVKALEHALACHAPLEFGVLDNRYKALDGLMESLGVWVANYKRGLISAEPDREYLQCKD